MSTDPLLLKAKEIFLYLRNLTLPLDLIIYRKFSFFQNAAPLHKSLFIILFIEYNKYTSNELEHKDKHNKEKIAVNEKLCNIEHALEKQSKHMDELLQYFLKLRGCIHRHNS